MITPLVLALFAVLANSFGSRKLVGADWTRRAPALGIVAWQALSISVLLSVVLAGLALALHSLPMSWSIASLLETCTAALSHNQTPGESLLSWGGAMVVVAILSRVGYSGMTVVLASRRHRRAQCRNLELAANLDADTGIYEVQHSVPMAYCIPGRAAHVVLTSSARALLDEAQLRAVVMHERAHLRGRHNLVVDFADILRRAFPHVASTELAHLELARLIEMRADDIALRGSSRLSLAQALVSLAQHPTPAGSLGASRSALLRLTRLAEPPRPIAWSGVIMITVATAVVLVVPMAIMLEPGGLAALTFDCLVGART